MKIDDDTDDKGAGTGDDKPEPKGTDARDERRREALKRRADAAEAKAKAAEDKLAEYEDRIAEAEVKNGEFDKILARKESLIEKLTKERDEFASTLGSERAGRRTDALVDRLATATSLPPPRVRGLLLAAKANDPELDIAPESIRDADVKSFTKTLSEIDPSSFETKDGGKARPRPGPAPMASLLGLPTHERPDADARKEAVREKARNRNRLTTGN